VRHWEGQKRVKSFEISLGYGRGRALAERNRLQLREPVATTGVAQKNLGFVLDRLAAAASAA
jgi:hypothetical protein